ncbi:Catalase domain protein [Methylobacterium sp. 4-46]|uniref:catalase family peroxidase n=1 Tax=unclassified Methylobacterium TaxID=2615210 RepID=UPI000152CD94|nr:MULTISPECIES: catalase family peroxidase [Methylobacterium]ACA20226.1 Catalase domain protein [Methylobacterium sp. 4-46]WFT79404.1 catalase family peroxidase [Methylobacterium nodulans]
MGYAKIGAVLAAGLGLAIAGPLRARAEEAPVPEQLVDVMNTLWGKHAGFRANHAKGVVVEGSFTPSREAAALSKASPFRGPAVPVRARFSDATGLPTIPDGDANAKPHGMALKFALAEGGEMDVVVNSLKFFPVATPEEFLQLLKAAAASGPGAPHPTPVETFVASHPAAGRAGAVIGTPTSLAGQVYNGVNAFVFVDAAGKRTPFRYRFVPVAGTAYLEAAEAAKRDPDFLMRELPARLAQGPVEFRVLAQLASEGDSTRDATRPWPEDRRLVEMGTLTLTKAVANSEEAQKALLFMPNALPDGIEVSDDPLIDARVQAYAVSFSRRSQ